VTNLGTREGNETVQLYATPPAPGVVSRLVGWTKLSLKPGETRHVAIAVDPRLLAHFDSDGRSWLIDAGVYTLTAGTSSTDAGATIAVTLSERRIKP
jgi:beta-glucosidase